MLNSLLSLFEIDRPEDCNRDNDTTGSESEGLKKYLSHSNYERGEEQLISRYLQANSIRNEVGVTYESYGMTSVSKLLFPVAA